MSVPQRQVWGRLVRLEANQGGGVTGPTGPIGPTGPTGIGLGGPTGPTGPIGPGSISGAAGTVLISDGAGNGVGDANLTWTSSTTTLLIGAINGASRPTITTAYGADGPLIIDFFSIDASGTVGGLGINMPDGNFNGLAVKFGPLPTPAANEYCIRPDAPSVVDLGAVGLEFRTLYTGTSVVTPQIDVSLTDMTWTLRKDFGNNSMAFGRVPSGGVGSTHFFYGFADDAANVARIKLDPINAYDGIGLEYYVADVAVDQSFVVHGSGAGGVALIDGNGSASWETNSAGLAGAFAPGADNAQDLGTPALRVRYLYCGTGTVASLPAAGTAGAGAMACVTDALAPAYGAAVVGGGAVTVSVLSTGAVWNVS